MQPAVYAVAAGPAAAGRGILQRVLYAGFIMRFDGIIFDLDGTLWDSCQAVAESWNESLGRHLARSGFFTAQDVQGIMGLPEKGIAEKLFSSFGEEKERICRFCLDEEPEYLSRHGGKVYPGVDAMLEALSEKAGLYIVSNCRSGYIESFLDFSGFGEYISDMACEGSTGLLKADNIRLLIEKHCLKNPVYIGDTALDERSAKQAGCLFVHAAYGFGQAEAPAGVIKAAGELAPLLEKL